jgi:hypothetical protein
MYCTIQYEVDVNVEVAGGPNFRQPNFRQRIFRLVPLADDLQSYCSDISSFCGNSDPGVSVLNGPCRVPRPKAPCDDASANLLDAPVQRGCMGESRHPAGQEQRMRGSLRRTAGSLGAILIPSMKSTVSTGLPRAAVLYILYCVHR